MAHPSLAEVIRYKIREITTWDEVLQYRRLLLADLRIDPQFHVSTSVRVNFRLSTDPRIPSRFNLDFRLFFAELVMPCTGDGISISLSWMLRYVNHTINERNLGPVESSTLADESIFVIRSNQFLKLAKKFGICDRDSFRWYTTTGCRKANIMESAPVCFRFDSNSYLENVERFCGGRGDIDYYYLASTQQMQQCETEQNVHFSYLYSGQGLKMNVVSNVTNGICFRVSMSRNHCYQWDIRLLEREVVGFIKSPQKIAIVIILKESAVDPTKFIAEDLDTGEIYEVCKETCCYIKQELIDEAELLEKTCAWKARHEVDPSLVEELISVYYRSQLSKKRKREEDEKEICLLCREADPTVGCKCGKRIHFCYCASCFEQVKTNKNWSNKCPRCWNYVDAFLKGI